MPRPPTATLLLLVLAGAALLTGCDASDGGEPAPGTALILAAASTTDAVEEAGALFEARTGIAVRVSSGASNALANQLLAGVPADLFLSADPRWVDAVSEAGLVGETRMLLGNELVLVVPVGNPAGVGAPTDLLSDRVRHVALAGERVPAGRYADEALRSAGVHEALVDSGRIARGHDVRRALGYVETGEAKAGVVYATDARISDRVTVVHRFPPEAHATIEYPLVLVAEPAHPAAARRFFEFLVGDEARAIFDRHGFLAPRGADAR